MQRAESSCHSGSFSKAAVLFANGPSDTNAAMALGVTRLALAVLINGRAEFSSDVALRIKKALGIPIEKLMRLQSYHDVACTRKREGEFNRQDYRINALDLHTPIAYSDIIAVPTINVRSMADPHRRGI